jgi:hypothetical protein
MRLASPRLIAVPIVMLSLALSACGGNTVTVSEVPGDPVNLSVPGTGEALAPAATPTPSATPTPTGTPEATTSEATPAPDTGGGATETTPESTGNGAAEAPAGTDSATTDQPPPAGSDAEQFEDFCAENPGAC